MAGCSLLSMADMSAVLSDSTPRITRPRHLALLDWLLLATVLAFVLFVAYRLFFALNYRWNWPVVGTYLLRYDASESRWVANTLLEGLFTTLRLSFWGMLIAIGLGFVMGLLRVAHRLLFRLISLSYVECVRNTPPLVLVFLFYYFASDQLLPLLGIEQWIRAASPAIQDRLALILARPELVAPFLSGVITIGIFQGAYITEIVRAGIQAVKKGQWEAAAALGLSRWQQLRLVVLPQAARVMLPSLANEFINTIKYSSIVSIISIQELTFQGLQVMASTQAAIEIWLTISCIYLLLCLLLSLGVGRLERRLAARGH